jgi:hypothetical protein
MNSLLIGNSHSIRHQAEPCAVYWSESVPFFVETVGHKTAGDMSDGKRKENRPDRRQAASQNMMSGRMPKHVNMADAIILRDSTGGKASTPMAFGWRRTQTTIITPYEYHSGTA